MVWCINTTVRVGVLVPGAADRCVFLQDGVVDTCFTELDPGAYPGHTCPNHNDAEVFAGRATGQFFQFRFPGIVPVHEIGFFQQHCAKLVFQWFSGGELHQMPHLFDVWGRRHVATFITQGPEELKGFFPDLGRDIAVVVTSIVGENTSLGGLNRIRPESICQPAIIA